MAIQVWDPFRELRQVEDNLNRFYRSYGAPAAAQTGAEDWNILMDVMQKNDMIVVKASLPGVGPEAIDLSVEDNILSIRAERKADSEEGTVYLIRERPTGSFYRALRLPEAIDAEHIHSSYEQGVLTITLPVAEEKKRKQIKINVADKELGAGKKN
jgi:HSP20 family protein